MLIANLILLCAAKAQASSDDRARMFAWFDKLGYTSELKGPFVQIVPSHSERAEMWLSGEYGFLLKSDKRKFSVLSLSLEKEDHPQSQPKSRHGFTYVTVPDAKDRLPEKRIPPTWHPANMLDLVKRGFDGYYTSDHALKLFILARALDLQGHPDESRQAFDLGVQRFRTTFVRNVQEAVAFPRLCDSVNLLADTRISFRTIKKSFEKVAIDFPLSHSGSQAQTWADRLSAMLSDTHRPVSDRDLAKLTPAARAAELVFQLRDQKGLIGEGVAQIGPIWTGVSPSARLIQEGDAAVPPLIAALNDLSLTRSLTDSMFEYARPVTVSHLARLTLEQIAHRNFSQANDEDIKHWWDRRQALGEARELAEYVTAKGEEPAQAAVVALAKNYPEVAFATFSAAIPGAPEMRTRQYLAALSNHPSSQTAAFARSLLAREDRKMVRFAAAWLLGRTDAPAAELAILSEWDETHAHRERPSFAGEEADEIRMLLALGGSKTAAMLGQALHASPRENQERMLTTLLHQAVPSSALRAELEKSILPVLLDVRPMDAPTIDAAPNVIVSPRAADLAVAILNRFDAKRYPVPVDFGVSPLRKEEARARFLRTAGLPAFTPTWMPARIAYDASVPEGSVLAQLNAFRSAKLTPETREFIERVGVAAIPEVEEYRRAMRTRGLHLNSDFDEIEVRLANIVSRVHVEGSVDSPVVRDLQALKGQSLTAERLQPIVEALLSGKAGANRVDVRLQRDVDASGFALDVQVTPTKPSVAVAGISPNMPQTAMWDYDFASYLGAQATGTGGFRNSEVAGNPPPIAAPILQSVKVALTAKARVPVLIRFTFGPHADSM